MQCKKHPFYCIRNLTNKKLNFNQVIISSFYFNTGLAVKQTDYHWLMFYPCIYLFAIYDAYINCEGEKISYAYLPFVFSAFISTIGVVYSQTFTVNGVLLGPIWLPIVCFVIGTSLGFLIRCMIIRLHKTRG